MAEVDASIPKKPRLSDIKAPNDELKANIRFLLGQLHYDMGHALTLCKIGRSNGDMSAPFSDAMCHVSLADECYPFSSFFQTGVKMVEKFLRGPDFLNKISNQNRIALDMLFQTIHNIEGISKQLTTKVEGESKSVWTVQLVHHLLAKLSMNQNYIIDEAYKEQLIRCKCCNEAIHGTYGDTSMGHPDIWHGSTDILLGGHALTNVAVEVVEFPHTDTQTVHGSPFEVKADLTRGRHAEQIYAKSIVFAFLHKMASPQTAQNFLIPTIAVSKTEVMFSFYDAEFDFMLRSTRPLPLYDKSNQLNLSTVISLWLTINYPITCTGLTDEVVETEHTADFLKHFNDEIQYIYLDLLRFGGCSFRYKHGPDRVFQMTRAGKPVTGSYDDLQDSD